MIPHMSGMPGRHPIWVMCTYRILMHNVYINYIDWYILYSNMTQNSSIMTYGKMYRGTAKITLTLSKAMEKQSTCFICITYLGKQNGTILLTLKWWTEQLEWIQILPLTNCMGHTANITKNHPNFWLGNGETIYTFHLYNLPKEAYIMAPYF